jgi:hypothetical protein
MIWLSRKCPEILLDSSRSLTPAEDGSFKLPLPVGVFLDCPFILLLRVFGQWTASAPTPNTDARLISLHSRCRLSIGGKGGTLPLASPAPASQLRKSAV